MVKAKSDKQKQKQRNIDKHIHTKDSKTDLRKLNTREWTGEQRNPKMISMN